MLFTLPPLTSPLIKHEDDEFRTYKEVILDLDSKKWFRAMKFEMDYMYFNKV